MASGCGGIDRVQGGAVLVNAGFTVSHGDSTDAVRNLNALSKTFKYQQIYQKHYEKYKG